MRENKGMIGKTISHYKILEKLGEGGMGVVYKAEDTKLKRLVALKFLPQQLTANEADKARFLQEAQAAAALNHPNVCVIHDIQEHGGQQFIVMEYVEGQTLRDKIKDERLKIKDIIDYATQITNALKAAHAKDVIHRDIKSENIMVTSAGKIKVMDFGLAKLKGSFRLTKTTSTVGTLAYSSPEQIQGQDVDARSDIFSFGVILYEMLTGQLPFRGEYESAIIYSILNEEPESIASQRPDLPVELEHIVNKVLEKDYDKRYQNTDKLLRDLKTLKNLPHRPPDIKKRLIRIPKPVWVGITFILLFVLFGLIYFYTRPKEGSIYQIKFTSPLTTSPGLEEDPTWSPEGSRLAYASDEDDNMDIWVIQITAGQRINLTGDFSGYDGKPAWSPDGEWIAFVSERDEGGIYIMPALGGIPKRIISLSFAISLSRTNSIPFVSWSPDGSELAYAVAGSLYTIASSGGTPVKVPLPPTGLAAGYSEPSWSPDGNRITCAGFFAPGVATSQIWSLSPETSDPVPITKGKYLDHNPVWSTDGRQLFFISDRGGSSDVWWLSVNARGAPAGTAQPLTAGAGVGAIALSRDGSRLAYTKVVDRSNIWSIPLIADRPAKLAEAEAHTFENNYIETVAVSPDGHWIAFDSNRRGNMDIWIMAKDGGEVRMLTSHPAHDWCPYWSPDGESIAFHSLRNGNRDIFMIPVRGGAVNQLTSHPAEDLLPIWSPDGKKIAFLSNRSGNMDAWLINSDGSDARQLTFQEAPDLAPLWAPDGEKIVFGTNRTGYYELFFLSEVIHVNNNNDYNPTQLTHNNWAVVNPLYWTRDGQTIFAYGVGGKGENGANLWAVSAKDGSARTLIDFQGSLKEPAYFGFDGKRIYFPLWERIGDLWLADLSPE